MEEEVNEVEAGENVNNNCEKEESSVVDTKEVNAQVHSSTATNCNKKSRIRETPTLSTDADSRTDTNLKRLRNLSLTKKIKKFKKNLKNLEVA